MFNLIKYYSINLVWWYKLVISALRRLGHEDWEFETSLGYKVRQLSKTTKNNNKSIVLKSKRCRIRMPLFKTYQNHSVNFGKLTFLDIFSPMG
jgi:hypothetical protein